MGGGEPIGQERALSVVAADQPTLPNLQSRLTTKQGLRRTSGQIVSIQSHWTCNFSYYTAFFGPSGLHRAFLHDGNRARVRGVRTRFSPFRLQSVAKEPMLGC